MCVTQIVKKKRKRKMKKLMFMLAAVVAIVSTKAASVDWSMNVTNQGAAWKGNGAYVMAFNGSDYDAVVKLLTMTGSDNMATDLGGYALTLGLGGTQSSVSSRGGAAKASGTSDGVTGDTMFWVVFTDGSMDASKAITWTAAISIADYDYEAGSYSPGTLSLTASSFTNAGTIASVPEPTSAILLVLGMAGLALRRKRA